MQPPTSRRRLVAITLGYAALAAWLASPALGVGTGKLTSESTANDIDVCVQQNLPDDSMVQTSSMVTKDRARSLFKKMESGG